MIVTFTLNSSIDKAYLLSQNFESHSVMRVSECINRAGGKGLNCARAIKNVGEEVLASGFAGGHNGQLLRDLLNNDEVAHDFVEVAGETRCCINALDPSGASTELLEPGEPVNEADFETLLEKAHELGKIAEVVTINGSVPKGLPHDCYQKLICALKAEGAKVLLDTSGALLLNAISPEAAAADALPYLIKPNVDEMAQILGKEIDSLDEVIASAKEIQARGIPMLVVSLGAKGALMLHDGHIYQGLPPKISVVNPVGSGDTMVGLLAVSLKQGLAAPDILRRAIAAATANCLNAKTGYFEPADFERLLTEVEIREL